MDLSELQSPYGNTNNHLKRLNRIRNEMKEIQSRSRLVYK